MCFFQYSSCKRLDSGPGTPAPTGSPSITVIGIIPPAVDVAMISILLLLKMSTIEAFIIGSLEKKIPQGSLRKKVG